MSDKPFHRLYLQPTQSRLFFSFVTYTPQMREQMICLGDLLDGEECINQVVCDFLLCIAEGILGLRFQVNSQFSMTTWWLFVLVSVVEEFNMSIFLGFKLIDWRNLDWICLIFLATCFQAHGGKDPFMIGIERRSSPKRRFVEGPCMRDMISEKMF